MTRQAKIFFRHVREFSKWGMTRRKRRRMLFPTKVHAFFEARTASVYLPIDMIYTGIDWANPKASKSFPRTYSGRMRPGKSLLQALPRRVSIDIEMSNKEMSERLKRYASDDAAIMMKLLQERGRGSRT